MDIFEIRINRCITLNLDDFGKKKNGLFYLN